MKPIQASFTHIQTNMSQTKQQTSQPDTCPVARAVELVADRWSLLLVRNALNGTRRFSDFQRELGVARSILAERLRRLVEAGIFDVQPASNGTSYQEYALTPKGEQLFPLVVALRQWGEQHLFSPGEARSELVETTSGKPLGVMVTTAMDGGGIAPGAASIRKVRNNSA
jgi:DNA-binding HxlR family transcriptional regulator